MTFEEWIEQYRPVQNHLDRNAAFDGLMFETFSPDLDFVRSRKTTTIWTLIECDDGAVITNGYHHVNRLGYFVTEVSFQGDWLEISLDD